MLIDYDDSSTFPSCLGEWDDAFERMIRNSINLEGVKEWRTRLGGGTKNQRHLGDDRTSTAENR